MEKRPKLDAMEFKMISQEDNYFFLTKFEEEEVREAVWDCGNLKSPGPDGYNFKFIKVFWYLLKYDDEVSSRVS